MAFKTIVADLDWSCYSCGGIISMFTNHLQTNNSYNQYWNYCVNCSKAKGHNPHNLKPFDEGRTGEQIRWHSYKNIDNNWRLP